MFFSCCSISDLNMGRLIRGDLSKGFVPPLASAVLDLLENHGEFLLKETEGFPLFTQCSHRKHVRSETLSLL